MKKQVISFKIPKINTRQHYVLFAEDSPYKPKVVNPKTAYKRKPKFVNKDNDWQ